MPILSFKHIIIRFADNVLLFTSMVQHSLPDILERFNKYIPFQVIKSTGQNLLCWLLLLTLSQSGMNDNIPTISYLNYLGTYTYYQSGFLSF